MSTQVLLREFKRLEALVNEVCQRFGVGEPGDDVARLKREVQSLRERVEALETPVMATEVTSNGQGETFTRTTPKRRGRKPNALKALEAQGLA